MKVSNMKQASGSLGILAGGIACAAWLAFGVFTHVRSDSTPAVERPQSLSPIESAESQDSGSFSGQPSLESWRPSATPTRVILPTVPDQQGGLVIRVVQSNSAPLAHVSVALARDESFLASADTDQDGTARLAAVRGPVDVLVVSAGALRLREQLQDGIGHHTVMLNPRYPLRGRILVDGMSPRTPVEFTVHSLEEDPGLVPPPFLRGPLGLAKLGEGTLIVTGSSLSSGEFVVDGLRRGWRGFVTVGNGLVLADGSKTAQVDDAAVFLTLRAHRKPSIRGRLMDRPGGEPTADAKGLYHMVCAEGNSTSGLSTDAAGLFTIPLSCGSIFSVHITLESPTGGRWTTDLAEVPTCGLELGDVFTSPTREISFVCVDEDGEPIPGVRAEVQGVMDFRNVTTSVDGRGRARGIPEICHSLTFSALGYAVRRCAIDTVSESDTKEMCVVLDRLPALDLVVGRSDSSSVGTIEVVLVSSDPTPFVAPDGRQAEPVQVDLGAAAPSRRIALEGDSPSTACLTLVYGLNESGRVFVPGLCPNGGVGIKIIDHAGAMLYMSRLTQGQLERREPVRVVLDLEEKRLVLTIVDEDGLSIEGAAVQSAHAGTALGRSRSDGVLVLAPLYGETIDLLVGKHGLGTVLTPAIELGAKETNYRVVLQPGRTACIVVQDVVGREVDPEQAWMKLDENMVGRRLEPSPGAPVAFADLPAGIVSCWIIVGGRMYHKDQNTLDPVITFTVPQHGSVIVESIADFGVPSEGTMELTSVNDPQVVLRGIVGSEAELTTTRFPTVLPGAYRLRVKSRSMPGKQAQVILERELVVLAGSETVVDLSP